jgi:hypothetical protein
MTPKPDDNGDFCNSLVTKLICPKACRAPTNLAISVPATDFAEPATKGTSIGLKAIIPRTKNLYFDRQPT